ncbi:hypothetical protein [Fischerella sp.]|nr:hypothetical protein [Fischerella sp.]
MTSKLTAEMSCCRKRERRRSGRWRQSAPCPCSAAAYSQRRTEAL